MTPVCSMETPTTPLSVVGALIAMKSLRNTIAVLVRGWPRPDEFGAIVIRENPSDPHWRYPIIVLAYGVTEVEARLAVLRWNDQHRPTPAHVSPHRENSTEHERAE